MIYSEGDIGPTTILAAMGVTTEDVFPRKDDFLEWNPDKDRQTDDTGEGHRHGDRMHPLAILRYDQLCLAQVKEHNGLLHIDHAHRLVVLIENQNLGVHFPV